MTRRMITMNVQTREISFTDLTAQEIAELQSITDDYYRRFDSPHLLRSPNQIEQTVDGEMMAPRLTRVAG